MGELRRLRELFSSIAEPEACSSHLIKRHDLGVRSLLTIVRHTRGLSLQRELLSLLLLSQPKRIRHSSRRARGAAGFFAAPISRGYSKSDDEESALMKQ